MQQAKPLQKLDDNIMVDEVFERNEGIDDCGNDNAVVARFDKDEGVSI